ncbi:hypothetical protein [Mongoliibacter ruber]|uniref:Uncharacterized protein n=1 Tax=Mongoliibacter ruber TaxID=1750599 RepID=A0A2T0WW14_9BACT|nr:hypothetical protein [Mongoliibacter ruber]PRY90857.1 hypothetical protein CLW00_101532 [Mongoliibacter ruber]
MPKPHKFPTLYNEVLQINISKLKGWGYLDPEQIKSGTLNWSRNGNPTGSISIRVNTHSEQPYIELKYNFKDEPRNYKVYLTSTPSNLNRGEIWYFICPQTKKRCRKLYSIGGYFLHREAFNGCMYETQTQSKKYRRLDKTLGVYFKCESLYSELYKKHFKKTYAGKPTKKYLRLIEQIQKAESIPYHEVERAILS